MSHTTQWQDLLSIEGTTMFFIGSITDEKWKAIQSRGLLRFVLLYGVLGWGRTTAALSSTLVWLALPAADIQTFFAISVCIFPLPGILLAMDYWRKYTHQKQR